LGIFKRDSDELKIGKLLKKGEGVELNDFKETIRFALEKEREAEDFYKRCSEMTARPEMKKVFLEMADEEKNHLRMLENFKPEHVEKIAIGSITNLKISDYLIDMEFSPNMSYQDLLILAMKREEASYGLYMELAGKEGDQNHIKLFNILAQEELRHKNRLEREYDEVIFQGN
jgi:rubrerythrin